MQRRSAARMRRPIARDARQERIVHDLERSRAPPRRRPDCRQTFRQAAGLGRVHDLGLPDDGRERQAAAERFCDRDQIGLDAVLLAREERAGAAESRLDLVGDQHDAVHVGDSPQLAQELRRRRNEAALTEHRLDDDRRDAVRRRRAVAKSSSRASSASRVVTPWCS